MILITTSVAFYVNYWCMHGTGVDVSEIQSNVATCRILTTLFFVFGIILTRSVERVAFLVPFLVFGRLGAGFFGCTCIHENMLRRW